MFGCGSPLAPQKNVATPPTRTPWFDGLRMISGGCDASAHGGISVRSRTLTLAVSNAAPKAACSPMSQFPRALIILLLSFCPLALSSCGVCKCEFVLCRTAFCPNRVCVRIFFFYRRTLVVGEILFLSHTKAPVTLKLFPFFL